MSRSASSSMPLRRRPAPLAFSHLSDEDRPATPELHSACSSDAECSPSRPTHSRSSSAGSARASSDGIVVNSAAFYIKVQSISLDKLRSADSAAPATPPVISQLPPLTPTVQRKLTGYGDAPPAFLRPAAVGALTPHPPTPTPAAIASSTSSPSAAGRSNDVRWRHLVRLSYHKAKVCANILGGHNIASRSRRTSTLVQPPTSRGVSASALDKELRRVKSVVEEASELDASSPAAPVASGRRTRSRSDAFMLRPGSWRPSAHMLLPPSASIPAPPGGVLSSR